MLAQWKSTCFTSRRLLVRFHRNLIFIGNGDAQFLVMDLSWPSLLVHIYGDVHWPSPFHIWWGSKTVMISSLVTSRSITNNDYNDKQWPSPFHINNKTLWWRTFNGRHYWCVYMVTFIDRHHFIFWWGSKNVTISSLVMVKRVSITKKWSSPFPMNIKAWWNWTTNLLLVK